MNGSDDFQAILICAVRYCLGRRTYMPGLVTGWIKGNMSGTLSANTIAVMLQDIDAQRKMCETYPAALGDPCDVKTWDAFEVWLKAQKGENNEG